MNQLSSKQGISTFIQKLWLILDDHGDQSRSLQWTQDGMAFAIINKNQFSDSLLPTYFKHSNFNSFVRQLNMYNFHKVKGDFEYQFKHNLFRKGHKVLLMGIKRNPTNSDLNFEKDLLEKLQIKSSPELVLQSTSSAFKASVPDNNTSLNCVESTSITNLIQENLKLKKQSKELMKSLDDLIHKSSNQLKKFNFLLDYITLHQGCYNQNTFNINRFMQHLKSEQEPLSSSTQYGSFFCYPVTEIVPTYYWNFPVVVQPPIFQLPNVYYQ